MMLRKKRMSPSMFASGNGEGMFSMTVSEGRDRLFLAMMVVVFHVLSILPGSVMGQGVEEFQSNAEGWKVSVNDPQVFAFDSFYPGMKTGKGNLTGPDLTIDLGTTTLRIEELGTAGGALRDASSGAQVSDAPLYVQDGVGSRWTFSTPIYGLYCFYGSADSSNTISMRLYSQGQLVQEISRFGGGLGIWAVGHGFVSKEPIDRVDFVTVGNDTAILIGAFVGLDTAESSLGVNFIPGYQGPNGSNVESDFGISTVPPPDFSLTVTTLFGNEIGTFSVKKAKPNEKAYLAYSMKGPGSTVVGALGVTLDLKSPKQASGFVMTNSRGEAVWQLWIPPGAKQKTIWFQSAQVGGVSNVVARQVN